MIRLIINLNFPNELLDNITDMFYQPKKLNKEWMFENHKNMQIVAVVQDGIHGIDPERVVSFPVFYETLFKENKDRTLEKLDIQSIASKRYDPIFYNTRGFDSPLIISPLVGHTWILLSDFLYSAEDGSVITIPAGFVTDFASVPRLFWSIFPQWHPKWGKAAILHDYLYETCLYSKEKADLLFLHDLKEAGLSKWKAYLMYWAVRFFGRRNCSK